jgi:alpha,alpha-trehalase
LFPLLTDTPIELAAEQLPATPDQLYGELFTAIQSEGLFTDSKTFVDAIPFKDPAAIIDTYQAAKDDPTFNLALFVAAHFTAPQEEEEAVDQLSGTDAIVTHIHKLWYVLERKTDTPKAGSSLLPLPYAYIVPGGRFREVYYWDSYFTMLGLKICGHNEMIESIVKNFAHLINTYGHIPNGNRTYYLSRSQPPFFGLMLSLLNEQEHDLTPYYQALEKEYRYWMEGASLLQPGEATKRVMCTDDGTLLNRYWDTATTPRQESYREDVKTADAIVETFLATNTFSSSTAQQEAVAHRRQKAYADLRAAAASGWDFSSRWFSDGCNLTSIETTDLVPVDLNCLLLYYESVIAKHTTDTALRNAVKTNADKRLAALENYFWHPDLHFFTDYHFTENRPTDRLSLAGLFPLFFSYATKDQAQSVAQKIEASFLQKGGLLTTLATTTQQWDAPNGWAPLQWIAHQGLKQYGFDSLAKTAATRWIQLNTAVYKRTGRLFEKYNVADTSLEAGGGEYPNQDGFGWTNGVLLALLQQYDPMA